MAIKVSEGKYKCSYCMKVHENPTKADACRDGHDLVYIAMARPDVNRLLNFLFSGERQLITEQIVKVLQRALRQDKHAPRK